jgi:hypothetical protein
MKICEDERETVTVTTKSNLLVGGGWSVGGGRAGVSWALGRWAKGEGLTNYFLSENQRV